MYEKEGVHWAVDPQTGEHWSVGSDAEMSEAEAEEEVQRGGAERAEGEVEQEDDSLTAARELIIAEVCGRTSFLHVLLTLTLRLGTAAAYPPPGEAGGNARTSRRHPWSPLPRELAIPVAHVGSTKQSGGYTASPHLYNTYTSEPGR